VAWINTALDAPHEEYKPSIITPVSRNKRAGAAGSIAVLSLLAMRLAQCAAHEVAVLALEVLDELLAVHIDHHLLTHFG